MIDSAAVARSAGREGRGISHLVLLGLLARLQAAAVAVRTELAEVADDLAVAQLERAVHAHADLVAAGAAVDRAPAVERPDVVLAGAGDDLGRAVARVDVVVARAAAQDVALARVVVAGVPVAPEDVVAGAARQAVGAVVAQQLVGGRAAVLRAAPAVEHLPEHAGNGRPPLVADLGATAAGLAPVARAALHAGGDVAAEVDGLAAGAAQTVTARRGVGAEADGGRDQEGRGHQGDG